MHLLLSLNVHIVDHSTTIHSDICAVSMHVFGSASPAHNESKVCRCIHRAVVHKHLNAVAELSASESSNYFTGSFYLQRYLTGA